MLSTWFPLCIADSHKPSYASMIEYFCKNSERLEVVNYFYKTAPWSIFISALNKPLDDKFNTEIVKKLSGKKRYKKAIFIRATGDH